ncbi:putative membrane protein YdzA [Actinomadura citrea]|nr:putative membrane protein YdzA [Actinomadura citrea]
MDMIRAFRFVSVAEAFSFLLLLLVAMPLKYGADAPIGVQVMGPVHGVLFMAYVGLVFLVREQLGWDLGRTVLALGAAVLPVAPFFVERHWTRPAAEPEPAGRGA